MFARILKIFGILAVFILFLFGSAEIWVYRNKEKIFRKAQEMVNESLNGNLEIGDFKFRPFNGGFGLNFTLAQVKLTDSLYKVHKKAFLEAELMHVALDFNGLYRGDIKIKNLVLQNGKIRIFVREDGYSNLSIFQKPDYKKSRKKPSDPNSLIKKLGNLRFLNFEVDYSDFTTGKVYGAKFHDASNILTVTDSTSNFAFGGSIFFNGLTFRPERGGFLIKQETQVALSLAYNEDKKVLKLYQSSLKTATNDLIGINGEFDFSDTLRRFRLNFDTKDIAVKNALPLLPKEVSKQIDSIGIQTNVDAQVKVKGGFSEKQPRVDVYFQTDTFKYNLPVGVLNDMKANGLFTNQRDVKKAPGPANTQLIASKVTGKFETVPFSLKLAVNNFLDPQATLDGSIRADSTNMDQLLDPTRYKFKNGKVNIDFYFNGSLKKFYDPKKDRFNGKIRGKASIQNLSMDYLTRQIKLRKINGELKFDESVFVIPDLSFSDGQNMLYMQGKVIDLIPYLFGSPKPLRSSVNITIPNWQLNWLEILLAPRTQVTRKKKNKLRLSELLDEAIDKMEIVAKLDSKNLRYKNFVAKDLKGEFTIHNNTVSIEYFVMKAFGAGNMKVSGEVNNSAVNQLPHLAVRGKITNADVHSVFYSFNNFGQKTITSDNLKGILNADFSFDSRLNNNVRIVPASMKGILNFSLTKGHIINFEPFMKMKRLIFKKRNFEMVKFAPIRNNFRLNGEEIMIDPMEIESNVITLYVDGVYSFGKKTDINIQIPLSNLKKRDSTYVLDPHNTEKKDGSKIFLRAIDEEGEVNIKLAFRKKKDKEKDEKKNKDAKTEDAIPENTAEKK